MKGHGINRQRLRALVDELTEEDDLWDACCEIAASVWTDTRTEPMVVLHAVIDAIMAKFWEPGLSQ